MSRDIVLEKDGELARLPPSSKVRSRSCLEVRICEAGNFKIAGLSRTENASVLKC